MFAKKTPRDLQPLDDLIDSVYRDLAGFTSDEEEFDKQTNQLQKLYRLREEILAKRRISPDVLVTAGVSLLSVLAILGYEHGHVITSKALSFVMKLR